MYRFLFICVLGVFSEDVDYFETNEYEIDDVSTSGWYRPQLLMVKSGK